MLLLKVCHLALLWLKNVADRCTGNSDAIIVQGATQLVGGTSASSPTFAGVIALVNDALIAAGKSPLGFLNPLIYGAASTTFTDVTSGSSFGCGTNGFPAEKGW